MGGGGSSAFCCYMEDNMIQKIKNYIEWGCLDLNEIITDKKAYFYFYVRPNNDICKW